MNILNEIATDTLSAHVFGRCLMELPIRYVFPINAHWNMLFFVVRRAGECEYFCMCLFRGIVLFQSGWRNRVKHIEHENVCQFFVRWIFDGGNTIGVCDAQKKNSGVMAIIRVAHHHPMWCVVVCRLHSIRSNAKTNNNKKCSTSRIRQIRV